MLAKLQHSYLFFRGNFLFYYIQKQLNILGRCLVVTRNSSAELLSFFVGQKGPPCILLMQMTPLMLWEKRLRKNSSLK